jgi:hypothetical protein
MNHSPTAAVPLSTIAFAAALLPFVTTHVSYVLAAGIGHVDWCIPYWDSCTSISATGRQLPEKLWFKAGMVPTALLTALLWWCATHWRRLAGPTRYRHRLALLPLLGALAALALLAYTVALGEAGAAYQGLRRSGVTLSFALTFIGQALLTQLIEELAELRQDAALARAAGQQRWLLLLLLGLGVLSLVLDAALGPGYARYEDAFEWWLALLLNGYFLLLARLWQREGARWVLVPSQGPA